MNKNCKSTDCDLIRCAPIRKLLLLISCLVVSAEGCSGPGNVISQVRFSPDGKTLAWISEQSWSMLPFPDSSIVAVDYDLCWRDAQSNGPIHRVRLEDFRYHPDDGPVVFAANSLSFSRDSRYLAVAGPYRMSCVNLRSGWVSQIGRSNERARSITWFSENEFGYVVEFILTAGQLKRCEKKVWMDRNSRGRAQRTLLLDGARTEMEDYSWGPGGRYLLLLPTERLPWRLVDTQRPEPVHEFGRDHLLWSHVAWRSDGNAAFCLSLNEKQDKCEAIAANFVDQRFLDAPERIRGLFVLKEPSPWHATYNYLRDFRESLLDPTWTDDDKWIVVREPAFLICMETWEVLDIKTLLRERSAKKEQIRTRKLGVPGWLLVETVYSGPGQAMVISHNAVNMDDSRVTAIDDVYADSISSFRDHISPTGRAWARLERPSLGQNHVVVMPLSHPLVSRPDDAN